MVEANKQAIAWAACLLVAWLREVCTADENPRSTLLHLLQPICHVFEVLYGGKKAVLTHLGAFGGSTPKTAARVWRLAQHRDLSRLDPGTQGRLTTKRRQVDQRRVG